MLTFLCRRAEVVPSLAAGWRAHRLHREMEIANVWYKEQRLSPSFALRGQSCRGRLPQTAGIVENVFRKVLRLTRLFAARWQKLWRSFAAFADVIIVCSIEPAASCRDVEGTSTADSIAMDSKSSGSKVLLTVAGWKVIYPLVGASPARRRKQNLEIWKNLNTTL